MRARSLFLLIAALGLTATLAACGGSGKSGSKTTTSSTTAGAAGGAFLAVAKAAPSGSPDPQIDYTLPEWQLLIFSHDGLVAFKRVGGFRGTQHVPHLAASIPEPTHRGQN